MESQRGDKVTDSLMAITVITVGVVNCFRSGPNDVRGCRNTIGRVGVGVGGVGGGVEVGRRRCECGGRRNWGGGGRRRTAGLNCQPRL